MKLFNFTILLILLSNFSALKAQCDDKKETFGIFITNTIKNPQANMSTDIPMVGEKGELSKQFENTFGRATMSGWLSIAQAEVIAVKGNTVTFKILEEKSTMTINGEKKNHFEKGKNIKFVSTASDQPQKFELFHANGKIKEKGFKRCGKLDGLLQMFDSSAVLSEEINFINGSKEGIGTAYYPSGKIAAVGTFKNDELEGQIIRFYPSGNKKSEFLMIKGEEVGAYKIYYENGILGEEGYKDETQNLFRAVTKYYDNGNKKTSTQLFVNKFNDGKVDTFNRDGILIKSITYQKGKRHGLSKEYDLNKGIIKVENYDNDKLLSLEIQDSKTNPISKEVYNTDKTTTYSLYYNNNKIKEKGTWAEHKINVGERLSYYDNGNLKEQTTFSNDGKMNGVFASFHENNKLHISCKKVNDVFDGVYAEYNAEGKLIATGTYTEGKKTGTWLEYNEKGKKKKVKY